MPDKTSTLRGEAGDIARAAYINGKCINIMSRLWNSPDTGAWAPGAVTLGYSEACVLTGVAAWLRWREKRMSHGLPAERPNFVLAASHSPVWDKVALLWNMEMRPVPVDCSRAIDPEAAVELCDDNTVGILVTATDTPAWVEELHELSSRLNALAESGGPNLRIHVDLGKQGCVLPLLHPELECDFRVERVVSISSWEDDKGEVFPGLGWVVWRTPACIPAGMSVHVNYLGEDIRQVGMNFSRPVNPLIDHYCRFVRLGRDGIAASLRDSGSI